MSRAARSITPRAITTEAIEDFSEAVKRDPKLAAARNGRGACHYAKGEFDKAIADFDAALKIDPKYVSALVNRANAWRGKKDFARAKADYDAALAAKPDLAAARKGADDMTKLIAKKAAGAPAPQDAAPKAEHEHN